jgi:polysaccharide deacetylase family protein (PEP-CTERM system associated)
MSRPGSRAAPTIAGFVDKAYPPARPADTPIVNALSVDVEDYYQVQAFAGTLARADWPSQTSRVERNTDLVLALFAAAGVRATFFTLAWVAERHGALIRRIVAAGHELASHGYAHVRADGQTPAAFGADVGRAKSILEQAGGVAVRGYRAATFSIGADNLWAFAVLEEAGYAYSSSIYPLRRELCGMAEAPRVPFYPAGAGGIEEYPLATVRAAGRRWPCAGGGHFRIWPYGYSRWALGRINRAEGRPAMFYFHPWEIDPDQPRIAGLPLKARARHYTGLGRMADRLRRLLGDFAWDRVDRVFLEPGGQAGSPGDGQGGNQCA